VDVSLKVAKLQNQLTNKPFSINPSWVALVTDEFFYDKEKLTPLVKLVLTSNFSLMLPGNSVADLHNIVEYARDVRRKKATTAKFENLDSYPTQSLEIVYSRNLNYFAAGQTPLFSKNDLDLSYIGKEVTDDYPRHNFSCNNNLKEVRILLSNWASDRQALNTRTISSRLSSIEKEYSLVFVGQQNKGRTANVGADLGSTNLHMQES
jgi:hypothetical protein